MNDRENTNRVPVAGEAPGGDWFYDELMTAQPEATREFYRARLETPARVPGAAIVALRPKSAGE